ncbi:non-heme iron oxygenase ferredoxin subunit [Sphingosinicella terrae]|uniref:non-heme iron oxygenase ferredoxin subunit n=1 Tax=Sphingosinicella terrae TaxID=2172047 RepID=UPI000E0DE634|nr:non-heme iron oxygenase ferredoxin subunit [Sphingosinicella terrae]
MTTGDAGQTLVKICGADEIEEEEIRQSEVDGIGKIALYRVGDEIFATADVCTHGQASLSEDGYHEGFIVTCSWHDGQFDIRTGEPCALPCNIPLKTYKVVISDGDVHIEI